METPDNYYLFEGYAFSTEGLEFNIYDEEWHKGIVYHLPEGKFDLCLNKIGWPRIIINYSNNCFKDLPFNAGTIELLPPAIKMRKIDDK